MHLPVRFRLIVFLFFLLAVADTAYAGFGITPPYVRNTSLTRNSTYEQQILLVRSNPDVPLLATVSIDAPEIEDWLEIVEGKEFLLPEGEQKVPMTVKVTVPDDAPFSDFEGAIRIKTGPADKLRGGAVNISLGAQVDVNLTVIDKEIFDFRVRKVGINDLNEGHKVGWLYFPGKIRFDVMLENIGNVPVAPTDVVFRIFDITGNVLLEETSNTKRFEKIKPFETGSVVAELPTRLPAGTYLARFIIYNGEEVKQEGEVSLSILPHGTLQAAGYGFFGLSLAHKISIILPALVSLALLVMIVLWLRRKKKYD